MTISIHPLMPNFGAEVTGVDLSRTLSDDEFQEILDTYYEHSLLLFPGQSLAPDDQARFAHCFGTPKIETRKQYNLRDAPEVSKVGNIVDESGEPIAFYNRNGVSWHTDGNSTSHVNAVTFLYAMEVPREGGDTMFCSSHSAYETLPDELKKRVEGRRCLISFNWRNDKIRERDPKSHKPLTAAERAAIPDVWQDLVQTHPVTGRKTIYFGGAAGVKEIEGVNEEEKHDLLAALVAHSTQPHLVYRHQWTPSDLIIWDNHATMHSATEIEPYEYDRRLLHRSFIYTLPTARPLSNLDEINAIFLKTG